MLFPTDTRPLPWLTRAAPSPSLLPSFPPGAGLGSLGWGWGKVVRAWLFEEHLPGAPPQGASQSWGGREALGVLWGGAPAHSHLWAVRGGGGSKPRVSGRGEEGLRAPSICQQPPVGLGSRPHQLGCLLPAGLDAVRKKGTEPLQLSFPLFVVCWRAIGCCL